jgi:hypothetical protein
MIIIPTKATKCNLLQSKFRITLYQTWIHFPATKRLMLHRVLDQEMRIRGICKIDYTKPGLKTYKNGIIYGAALRLSLLCGPGIFSLDSTRKIVSLTSII